MLGICNGFQALIKLGLVPYGKIVEAKEDAPTLTYNSIGRHASCLVNTRIASVKSPWLAGTEVGDIHTIPVSHGEGRFIASDALIRELAENGQIATQYVDMDGNPTSDIRFNPNNSNQAIEGILSPDGRIFGKMGHSERIGRNLYRNVLGNFDQKLSLIHILLQWSGDSPGRTAAAVLCESERRTDEKDRVFLQGAGTLSSDVR